MYNIIGKSNATLSNQPDKKPSEDEVELLHLELNKLSSNSNELELKKSLF